jgi:hypothetical protein
MTIAAVSHPDAQRPLKKEFSPAPSSMERLGIVALAETDDLSCCDTVISQRIELLARIEVFEVHLLLH